MSPPWRALESRRLRTQLMTWTARPPDSADANMFQNSFIFFIYDLQEVPAGFHVGHHGRHSILYLRNGCCQGAHGGTVGHIGYAGGRNLHGGAYMPDVARCIILRRRCPAIDKVGHRAASIEAAVILQQLDEGTVAVTHRPELAERLVLRGAHLSLPTGGGRKSDIAGIVVAQSPGHSVYVL